MERGISLSSSIYAWSQLLGRVAILADKRSAGVTPVVNLRECIKCMPLPNVNNAVHSSFEIQRSTSESTKRTFVLETLKTSNTSSDKYFSLT